MGKVSGWKWKALSFVGRPTFLQSVLSSIPIYVMSAVSIPLAVLKAINHEFYAFSMKSFFTSEGFPSFILGSYLLSHRSLWVGVSLYLGNIAFVA